MANFFITITETLQKTFEIYWLDTIDEALEHVRSEYKKQELILDCNDLTDVVFSAERDKAEKDEKDSPKIRSHDSDVIKTIISISQRSMPGYSLERAYVMMRNAGVSDEQIRSLCDYDFIENTCGVEED